MEPEIDDEVVFDRVIIALIQRPHTFAELFSRAGGEKDAFPQLSQIDTALDILRAANALDFLRKGNVFRLKSESRTWLVCKMCNGAGFQDRRCPFCKGNGLYTPIPEL